MLILPTMRNVSSLFNLFLRSFGRTKIMSGGFPNKQNFRHWATESAQMMQEKNITYTTSNRLVRHNEWSCYRSLFFLNESVIETVNGERYWNTLNTFLTPVVEQMDNRNELWFQKMPGATCHTSIASLQLFHEIFGENIISQRCTLIWPPRSQTYRLQISSFGAIKKIRVYISILQTLEDLKHNIRQEI